MEETERIESERANCTVQEKYYQPSTIAAQQLLPSGKMAIDVYGHQTEHICDYHTCNHIFQHMVIVANADAVILSIMQQEYHYNQKVTHLLGFLYRPSLCYNRREKGRHLQVTIAKSALL